MSVIKLDQRKSAIDETIDQIRVMRDACISELLQDEGLNRFLENHFGVFAISATKRSFIKLNLTELRNTNLDLVHYASLIKDHQHSTVALHEAHPLFLGELYPIFEKYGLERL